MQRWETGGGPHGEAPPAVLVLYAGPTERHDSMARILRALGLRVVEIDTKVGGAAHDVTRKEVQEELLARIRAGEFAFVFAAPPCQSYSVAHRPRLRSTEHPEGLPEVPREWQAYLCKHNSITAFTVRAIRAIHEAGGAAAAENPAARDAGVAFWRRHREQGTLWHVQGVRALELRLFTCAQCAFGAPHQKWTTVGVSPSAAKWFSPMADFKCQIAATGGRHADVAHGRDDSGASKAERAAAYPRRMNVFIAAAIVCATSERNGGGEGGRVADGPQLCPGVRRRVEAARERPLRFATRRLLVPEATSVLRRAPMPGDLHREMQPTRPRASRLKGRPLPAALGTESWRALANADRPLGHVRIAQLYNQGVYEGIIVPWLHRAAAATRCLLRGETVPKLETVSIPQEAMPEWARGIVWDCTNPNDCRPVVRSTAQTPRPGARQLDREAVRRIAQQMEWPDTDIVEQVAGGGVETRSDCPLTTVLSWHHGGFEARWQDAERVVRAEMADEWVSRPYEHLPYVPARLLPRNVILQARTRPRPDGTLEHYEKPRISQDSSDGADASVNAGVAAHEYGVELPTVQQYGRAMAIVDTAGTPPRAEGGEGPREVRAEGYVIDATAAFRFVTMQEECLWTQCFLFWQWEQRLHGWELRVGVCVDRRMAFGGRYSPNRFERVSRLVGAYIQTLQHSFDLEQPPPLHARAWTNARWRHQGGGGPGGGGGARRWGPAYLQAFIDDYAGASLNDPVTVPAYLQHLDIPEGPTRAAGGTPAAADARVRVHAMIGIYGLLQAGLEAAPDKTLVGDPIIALGLRVSRTARRIDIPEGKRAAVLEAIARAVDTTTASPPEVELEEAERLVGRLANLAQVAPDMVQYMAGGYRVVAGRWARHARHCRRTTLRLRHGSAAWRGWMQLLGAAEELVKWNEGVEMAPRLTFPDTDEGGTVTSTTDASGEDGVGGYVFSADAPGHVWLVSAPWPADVARALRMAATKRAERPEGEPIYSMPAAELFGSMVVPTAAREAGMPGHTVIAIGDCQPIDHAIAAERSRNAQIQAELRSGLPKWDQWLSVSVPRELNMDADRLSHPELLADVVRDATAAGLVVHVAPISRRLWQMARDAIEAGAGALEAEEP